MAGICALALVMPAQAATRALDEPGPYAVGVIEESIARIGTAETFIARIYYPAATPGGQGADLHLSGAPYPAIAFGHALWSPVTHYSSTLRHLASWGFIVIAPRTYESGSMDNDRFTDDLRDSLTWLTTQNDDAGSRFYQGVDASRFGVAGHSMGGGASILATRRDKRIIAAVGLAPANTSPASAITAMESITRPMRLLAASLDSMTPPSTTQIPMYQHGNAPRQLVMIEGGGHCGFYDEPYPDCGTAGTLPRATMLQLSRQLLTEWFMLYLRGDTALSLSAWGAGAPDPLLIFTRDSGIVMAPLTQTIIATSTPITLSFTLTNTGPLAIGYAIETQSEWLASVLITRTADISPGAAISLSVQVYPPITGSDTLTVVARSVFDRGTAAWATVQMRAELPWQPLWFIYVPQITNP
jgi:dienelactone hydrolase